MPAGDRACGGATDRICAPSNVTLKQGVATTGALSFSPLGKPSAGATYTVTGDTVTTITVEAETGYVH